MSRKHAALAAVSALVSIPTAMSAATAAPAYVLDLQLNEAPGATTAVDDSGLQHHGAVGTHVVLNRAYADWDRHSPSEGVAYGYDHLIKVADAADGSLDPGSGNFSVTFRFRTRDSFGNIMQKGQSNTVGGQVKFQIPKGRLTCMFKTPQGTATAGSGTKLLNDDVWHVVRCDRTPTSVTMYVDGIRTGRSSNPTGTLDNTKPWTFGGKSECNAVTVTCDYFAGEIDYVRMTKG